MRTQQPRDVPGDIFPDFDGTGAAGFPGLCCPDDPLDLVFQFFSVDRAPPPSLAALGIGGGEPPLRELKQEHEPLLEESAYGVSGGGLDSWASLSSFLLDGLCGLEEIIDVDEFFADDVLGAGSDLLLYPTGRAAEPSPPPQAHITCGGGAVPNDALPPPLPAPMPVRSSFAFQPNAAVCRAFNPAVFSNTPSPSPPPPVYVTHNSTPSFLPALMPPPPAAPTPMPPTASLLHAYAALPGIVSDTTAPAPPLARALHPNAALAGVYFSSSSAPAAHTPPSLAPSSSPPSRASSGSRRCPSSSTTSETECLPRKQRRAPAVNRRRNRSWRLDFPLHALPPVAPPPPPEDAENRNNVALVLVAPPLPAGNNTGRGGGDDDGAYTTGGGGGIIHRRRPAPRQRNREAHRVCSHCHSAVTPQWRAGPDGPGTLCNACGIRYAANRLLPEYRPSTAPSFRSGQHSNRHRKVIKLREQVTRAAATTTTTEEPSSEQEQGMEDDTSAPGL